VQIEGDRSLVAGQHLPPKSVPAFGWAHASSLVAGAGGFYVDHLGSEIGEERTCEGPRDHLGKFDYAKAS
jgi:hypothetical protein